MKKKYVVLISLGMLIAASSASPWVREKVMELIPEDWRYEKSGEFSHNIGIISELNLLMVPFQKVKEGDEELFNAPCPFSPELDPIVFNSLNPMGSGRDLEDITKASLAFKDAQDIMMRIRSLLILHYKLDHPRVGEILGGAGSVDYKIAVDTSIPETLALAHMRVEGGLFENMETLELPPNTEKIILTKKQKDTLQKIYKACRMTNFQAHRIQGPYVRTAYLPTKVEEKQINHALGISQDKPDEVVCTYKRLDTEKKSS